MWVLCSETVKLGDLVAVVNGNYNCYNLWFLSTSKCMRNCSSEQKAFYEELARILWEDWDPIGVYEPNAEWDDEYDSYVPHIFRLAIEGKDAVRIANSLSASVKQNMGLNTAKGHDLKIAKLMVKTKQDMLD